MNRIELWIVALCATGIGFAQEAAPKPEAPAAEAAPAAAADRGKTITLITKGTRETVWKAVRAGAIKAGREMGVKIVWRAPVLETDAAGQLRLLQQAANADGVLLAPINDTVNASPSGPLVVFDTPMKGGKPAAFVGCDYTAGGELAAKRMGEILSGKGRVVLLKHDEKNAATLAREKGFRAALGRDFPEIKIVTEDFCKGEREQAAQVCEQLLGRAGGATGVFATSEAATYGALAALEKRGQSGQIKLIGSDISPRLLQALSDGTMDSLLVHDHFKMGYESVKAIVDTWDGKTVEAKIEIPTALITQEKMADPDIRAMFPAELR